MPFSRHSKHSSVKKSQSCAVGADAQKSSHNVSCNDNIPLAEKRPALQLVNNNNIVRKPKENNNVASSSGCSTTSVAAKPVRNELQKIKRVLSSILQPSSAINERSTQKDADLVPALATKDERKEGLSHNIVADCAEQKNIDARIIGTAAADGEQRPLGKQMMAYSTSSLPTHDLDIDSDDKGNPFVLAEYVNDIYDYLRQLEVDQAIRENYLDGQTVIQGHMRAVLVDWLVQVHARFKLLSETLYMTVALLDRYLQESLRQESPCTREELQLVGVTALLVAGKYEEMYPPEMEELAYMTDGAYEKADLRRMELRLLKTLDFKLGRPLPIQFLRRFSKAAQADARTHSLAKYLMELSLVEYSMAAVRPSMLAAAALYIALLLENETASWNETLVYHSKYTEAELSSCVRKIATVVLRAHAKTNKKVAVRKKFEHPRNLEVSTWPYFTDVTFNELARGVPLRAVDNGNSANDVAVAAT